MLGIGKRMMKTTTSPILQLIRRSVEDQRVKVLTDQELLNHFRSERDEAAFHALLRRHGSMVLDVCRNVLGNEADAEDAFQATFLILAQKAGAIRNQSSVGSWLHGVAYRTALKARAGSAKRQKHEARLPSQPSAGASDDLTWREVQQVLHAELNSVAECYRAPLVLCYLEGKTQVEAAKALGVSAATVNKRLEQGRARLRVRLVRRGLGPAAVSLTAAWPLAATASAQLSPVLVAETVRAAQLYSTGNAVASVVSAKVAALTEGVMKAMFMTKIKAVVAVVLMLGFIGTGATVLTCRMAAAQGKQPPAAEAPGKELQKEEKEAFTAWGKEVGGLQAGLGFRPGEQRAYHHGETVKLVVRVRNVGKEAVKFQYLRQFFIETPPRVTYGDSKPIPVPLGRLTAFGIHLPVEVNLAPAKEIELYEWQPRLRSESDEEMPNIGTLYGTGKFLIQYERVFGNSSSGSIQIDPALSKLATGKLELEIKSDPPPKEGKASDRPPTTPENTSIPESARNQFPAKHDFTNLQRLATALENYNYPEDTADKITVWCQGGGKGTSVLVKDAKTLDVATACHYIVDGDPDKKRLDLENVAVMSADGATIRFVNIKEKFAANKPFGLLVNRGELVMVLQLRKD